jgi:hypothetical protein
VREEDLYLLDHESTDGSTAKEATGGAVVIRVENKGVHDHQFLRLNVHAALQALLLWYDYVCSTLLTLTDFYL